MQILTPNYSVSSRIFITIPTKDESWVENHPSKTNPQACLFPSSQSVNLPIGDYAVFNALDVSGRKLGKEEGESRLV